MPKVSIGPLGVNAAVPSEHKRKPLPPRSTIKGWTPGAARRNARFLMTVDPLGLDGVPVAVTLSTKEIPANAADWSRRIASLIEWCRRRGLMRYHWVIEWQARGAPHLHAMLFFDPDALGAGLDQDWQEDSGLFAGMYRRRVERHGQEAAYGMMAQYLATGMIRHWVDRLAVDLAPSDQGQHIVHVTSIAGWAMYLSKHASRGVAHYQRQGGTLPPGWETSGRLWAKGGKWPTRSDDLEVDHHTLDRFRRLLARHQRAEALNTLAAGIRWNNPGQVRSAKGQLRHLARRGSGRRMDEDVRLAVHLANRAWTRGDLDAHARHLDQVRLLRAKAGEGHKRAAIVRGSSRHVPEELARRMLDHAMDHAEGYSAPWVPAQVKIAEARRLNREAREAVA
jgi:hypothetical protein